VALPLVVVGAHVDDDVARILAPGHGLDLLRLLAEDVVPFPTHRL
jgi:hypothetical protein